MRDFSDIRARAFLRGLFDVAVASADPFEVLAGHLPEKPRGRCIVVGAGKASAAMAAALEAAWPDTPISGIVVTRYGHSMPTRRIKVVEAAHPVPDNNSVMASMEILRTVSGLTKDDLVIALISGGGSALLVAPIDGLTLDDKQRVNRALLQCGASIGEMNTVRKQLSAIKGGKLAQACAPARIVTFVISDVPGDDPGTIASGPTVQNLSTPQDALDILSYYNLDVSDRVRQVLHRPSAPGPLIEADIRMIASPVMSLSAAAGLAKEQGATPLILGDALEGEARDVGKVLSSIAVSCQLHGNPVSAPCVILSGGETTVSIRDGKAGRGGRNTELLLAATLALEGRKGIWGLAGDTDGIDGTEDAAGAIFSPETLARAKSAGVSARDFLANHDSYSFFRMLDDLVVTGPTLTNVNDFRAILVLPVN